MRRFENPKSKKFWQIEITAEGLTITKGREGGPPRTQHKKLRNANAAEQRAQEMIERQLKAGFEEVGSSASEEAMRDEYLQSLQSHAEPAGEYTVVLTDAGDRRIAVIKAIRSHSGLGLKESKEVTDAPPTAVPVTFSAADAAALIAAIEECGGQATTSSSPDAPPSEEVGQRVTLLLVETGPKKIQVIKLIREVTQLGLKESKDIADSPPAVISAQVTRARAEKALADLHAAGARARIDEHW